MQVCTVSNFIFFEKTFEKSLEAKPMSEFIDVKLFNLTILVSPTDKALSPHWFVSKFCIK